MHRETTAKQKERAELNAAIKLYEQQGGQIERLGNLQTREVKFNPSDKRNGVRPMSDQYRKPQQPQAAVE